jgi:hypothetical protein
MMNRRKSRDNCSIDNPAFVFDEGQGASGGG